MYINRALLKEGYSSFSLSILEYCSEEDLIQREQHFIDALQPEYNICTTAGSTLGKMHLDKTKDMISETKKGTFSGEANHFSLPAGYGRIYIYILHTPAGRDGKNHTEESRAKMAESKLGGKLSFFFLLFLVKET
jgi:group I intron endonuclease